MSLKLGITLSKNEFGKYDAEISCERTDGNGAVGSISIMQDDPLTTACEALKCILRYTPNLDQEEFTKAWNSMELVEWPDEGV